MKNPMWPSSCVTRLVHATNLTSRINGKKTYTPKKGEETGVAAFAPEGQVLCELIVPDINCSGDTLSVSNHTY